MTSNERDRFRACWLKLRTANRVLMFSEEDKQAAQREVDVYFETLDYLPIEAVERAAAELQRTSKRMPTAQKWCEEADRIAARTAPDAVQARIGQPAAPDHPVHAAKAKCIADLRALADRLESRPGLTPRVEVRREREVFNAHSQTWSTNHSFKHLRHHQRRPKRPADAVSWPRALADMLERQPTRLPRRPRCGGCNDTGLEELVCGRDGHFCGRELCADEQAGEHVYVRQCACRAA